MEISISSLASMRKFAGKVAKNLRGAETLALIGELGAGKTTFTKMLLRELGIRAKTASPTFVLMVPYKTSADRIKIVTHMDLYRLKNFKDVAALGVNDFWGKPGNIFIIEWADKITKHLPKKTIRLIFKVVNRERKITIINAPKYFKI